jgi:hypothetical protein
MWRHSIEATGTSIAERAPHLVDLVRVSIERMAHHQEHAVRPETLRLLGYGFGGRLAEHHLVHLTENYATR